MSYCILQPDTPFNDHMLFYSLLANAQTVEFRLSFSGHLYVHVHVHIHVHIYTSTCIFINTTSTDTTVNPQAVFPLKKQQMFLHEINQLLNMLGDKMGPHLPSVLNIILILANSCSRLLSELRNVVSED